MKHIVISFFCWAFFMSVATAQFFANPISNDTVHFPYWIGMMQDPDANFRFTQSAFEKYWAGRSDYKGTGWKVFKRWEYINEPRVGNDGKLPKPSEILDEYTRYLENDHPGSASGNWTQVGPVNLPSNSTGQPNGLGRINAIAFHPSDANIIYAGSPSGGLWKTSNGGITWSVLTSATPTLGVSSILIHPTNPNIILIGTGDRDGGDAPGVGVYKSVDGGVTWTPSNTGITGSTVGMMIMHPADPNIILAATRTGIYKSANGGSTWVLKSSNGLNFKDIKFKPGNPAVVYASCGGLFYRSVNTGETWTQITSGLISGTRLVIGVSANQPNYVYLVQTNGPFAGLLRSTDSGLSFSTQSTTPNIMSYECDGSGTNSQASYDLCIAVDPNNANIMYVGGINTWKSSDGGVTWTIISHWIGSSWGTSCAPTVHADIHSLDWSPLNGKLYSGNDGGVYVTANGGTNWSDISSGLAIAQVYKIGQSATKQSLTLDGYQDNGTAKNSGTVFTTVIGGDGMECIVDYSDTTCRYGELYYGDVRRSTGGSYSTIAKNGVNGITETGGWVMPYILHETVPSTMFAGYKNVWRSTNVKAASTSSVAWTMISTGETVNCNVLEQSPANVDILYVSRGATLQRSDNANGASPGWTVIPGPGGFITDIEAHPVNANIVYATAGNGVYTSVNKGLTWADISGTLPFIPINCIVYCKNSNDALYIGTQTGVFYKDASMNDWVMFNSGLPTVDVRELEIWYDPANPANSRLMAATYGRGLWQSDLNTTSSLLSVTPWIQNVGLSAGSTTFAITTTKVWTASVNQGWCAVTPSGNGSGTIIASFDQNTLPAQRVADITITATGVAPIIVTLTQAASVNCGSLTINHVAGEVAPVAKTVTYGTLINIPGEPLKCWITSNLGADHQATAVSDNTEPSAGWYWQFNRKQGYKRTTSAITPAWNSSALSENSDWQAANDPCISELGNGWRIPTLAEWNNVIAGGGWINWDAPYAGLQLHASGFLWYSDGSLNNRGSQGYYWSNAQSGLTNGWHLFFNNGSCQMIDYNAKTFGFSLRCLSEVSAVPTNTTVTGAVSGTICYDATQTITIAGNGSSYLMLSGANATMIAGRNIFYLPGTSVQSGAHLWGYIAPTGPWCNIPSMPAVNTSTEESQPDIVRSYFKVYPNPTTGNFTIEINRVVPADEVRVDIYGIWGEKLLSTRLLGEHKREFSFQDKPAGVYFIRLITGNTAETVKVIKQ